MTARLEAGLDVDEVVRHAPDLIVFDSRLGSEGDVVRWIAQAARILHIPLILCTGAVQEEVDRIVETLSPVPLPVVRKPFDIDTLLEAIRVGLDRRCGKGCVVLP